ncbi:hypothetical protein EJB05_53847, partial [Eragrostis curvula]
MGRLSCSGGGGGVQPKLRKGLWSPEEDEKLYNHIIRHGVGCWSSVPKLSGKHLAHSHTCRSAPWLLHSQKQQPAAVFDPFPVTDFGGGFDLAAGVGVAALYGGQYDAGKAAAGFVADYSSVLDVSENLGYGDSSSNSSNWNCAAEMGNVLDSDVLDWASNGGAAKAEPFTEMEQHGGGYGDDDDALEHKFALPCHEQSLAHFDFSLEYFI